MKLKVLSDEDCEQVRLWRNESLEFLRTPFLITKEQQIDFYKNVICNRRSNSRYWGIYKDNEFIGMCGIENIQWENKNGELSLLLNPRYHLDVFGEEIIKLLLHEGFMNMNLENIYTEVYECSRFFNFWVETGIDYGAMACILPKRKYFDGKYYDSVYINFGKEDFNENIIS